MRGRADAISKSKDVPKANCVKIREDKGTEGIALAVLLCRHCLFDISISLTYIL